MWFANWRKRRNDIRIVHDHDINAWACGPGCTTRTEFLRRKREAKATRRALRSVNR